MYHVSVVADETVLDAQTVSMEQREKRNEERKRIRKWNEEKERQRDNKTEKSLCLVGVCLRLLITILDVVMPLFKRH